MKTLTYYFIALAIITFAACKKQSGHISFEKQLIGKWLFTGQGDGFSGQYTPADPLAKTVLEFRRNKTFIKTVNEQTVDKGPYNIIRTKNIYTGKDDNAIEFNITPDASKSAKIITISNDTLNIYDNVYDGYSRGYIRIK